MYLILFLMLSGILFGYFIIPRQTDQRLIKAVGKVQSAATIGLLFVMGAWLGGNADFWQNIQAIGIAGITFALTTIAGSVAVVFLLCRLVERSKAQ